MERSIKSFGLNMRRFFSDESGPTATEYAVMLAVVMVACIGAISAIGISVQGTFTTMNTELTAALGV